MNVDCSFRQCWVLATIASNNSNSIIATDTVKVTVQMTKQPPKNRNYLIPARRNAQILNRTMKKRQRRWILRKRSCQGTVSRKWSWKFSPRCPWFQVYLSIFSPLATITMESPRIAIVLRRNLRLETTKQRDIRVSHHGLDVTTTFFHGGTVSFGGLSGILTDHYGLGENPIAESSFGRFGVVAFGVVLAFVSVVFGDGSELFVIIGFDCHVVCGGICQLVGVR
mmetsp:Transcript_9780/g.20801  ORF Transcript_9780/g.20801 Transcript_9780/m.20801 type:complete len:224 (-) Transcript_9780:320-991(-)